MEMESFMDDLLNFSMPEENDDEEGELEEVRPPLPGKKTALRKKMRRSADPFGLINPNSPGLMEEEDLEWISNKDAFPVIETFVGVLPTDHLRLDSPDRPANSLKQLSPVSVLESSSQSTTSTTTTATNSSGGSTTAAVAAATTVMSCCGGLIVPVKARSKNRRLGRRDFRSLCIHIEKGPSKKKSAGAGAVASVSAIGRKCQHCGAEKTPQWRAGPLGPKTLCNACGVRFKSGRLVPEYRPASSPTFSAELHSNSHRKIMEIRRQRQVGATLSPTTGKAVDKW